MKLKDNNTSEESHGKISFDNILKEIQDNTSSGTIGNLEFTELTMKQQRRIMNGGYDNIEISAKFANVYNVFIKENVRLTDDMVSSDQVVTLETRPAILSHLRQMSLGEEYYDDETDKTYKMVPITEEMLKPSIEDEVITFGNIEITLSVPNLVRDSRYNDLLCIALKPYTKKKNAAESDAFPVMDMYQVYEVFKYIKTLSFKGTVYDFDQVAMNDKMKFYGNLPAGVMTKIHDYIKRVEDKKEETMKAVDDESGETISPNIYTIFFAKTAHNA